MSLLIMWLTVLQELSWLDQELPERSERGDLSVGDAGDVGGRPSRSEAFLIPTDQHLFLQRQRQNQNQYQNQYQYQRKANEKRWGQPIVSLREGA